MDPTLLLVLTIFVVLTAIAMMAQACALIGVLMVVKRLERKVDGLLPQAAKLVEVAKETISETKAHASEIGKRTIVMLDMGKDRLPKSRAW